MEPDIRLSPFFLYGTAWKEGETAKLTAAALTAGFRGIDTANQRRHYFEEAVGQGINAFLAASGLERAALFLQTKYTFARGQDHRMPYDVRAPIADQVVQSLESSLQHLRTSYVDSLVLHGPSEVKGINDEDWQAWRAMESLVDADKVRVLGVSNCQPEQVAQIYQEARIKPRFLQNRCYANMGWDRTNRLFCKEHGMIYQGFSLLTANAAYIGSETVQALAAKYRKTVPQIIFRFCLDIGMLPLTGTTSAEHMREDLELVDFHLTPDEIKRVEMVGRR